MAPPFPKPHTMDASYLTIEFLYAAIIIAICVIIYAKTKEMYRLSEHEGIRHFREAFLFFALAYLFRLIPILFKLADLRLPGYRVGFVAGFFLFGYASAMATISIARSVTWKNTPKGPLKEDALYHALALVLSLLVLFTGSILLFFLLQAGLIIAALVLTKIFHQQQRKRTKTHTTYLLLLLFWMMNIAIISTHRSLQGAKEFLYASSLAVFIIILYKVAWRTRR